MNFKKAIILVLVFLVTCTEEITHPTAEVQSDSTNTSTNTKASTIEREHELYTVSRIKNLLHEEVLKSPVFSYDEIENAYVFHNYDLNEYFTIDNIRDMIEVIVMLGINERIDLNSLGPDAKQHYRSFMGYDSAIFNKDIHTTRSWYNYRNRPEACYFVPYYFDANPANNLPEMNDYQKQVVRNAMKVIERETRVRFVLDTEYYQTQTPVPGIGHVRIPSSDTNRIVPLRVILRDSGALGSANIGNDKPTPTIIIHVNRGFSQRIVLHELGHILGLHHEQGRSDRDEYLRAGFNHIIETEITKITRRRDACGRITTTRQNISGGSGVNFNYSDTNYISYDLASIMHYGINNGFYYYKKTIEDFFVKKPRFQYNKNDALPIVANSTEYSSTVYHEVGDIIRRNTSLGRLLEDLDKNRISYTNQNGVFVSGRAYFGHDYFPPNPYPGFPDSYFKLFYILHQYYTNANSFVTNLSNVNNNQVPLPGSPVRSSINAFAARVLSRKDIACLNPNIKPTDFCDSSRFPTYDDYVFTSYGVHQRNVSLIDEYMDSRIEGSQSFDPNSRLEYFWTAPVIANAPVYGPIFLSERDLNALRYLYP